jgi:hypothetical protein
LDEIGLAQPIRRAEKLARKNVGLYLFPLPWRISFDLSRPAVNGVSTKSKWSRCNLTMGIAVKSEVADLMSDDDSFIRRCLMLRNIHEPRGTIK